MPAPEIIVRHTMSVIVVNEPGVLARVVGLFSGRGYNIESLTVAEVDPVEELSRITLVTSGTPMVIEQIKAQLGRLVPVHSVEDLTEAGPDIERELALVKLELDESSRTGALRLAEHHGARVVDLGTRGLVFEMMGPSDDVDAFIAAIREEGPVELARTGIVAIGRIGND